MVAHIIYRNAYTDISLELRNNKKKRDRGRHMTSIRLIDEAGGRNRKTDRTFTRFPSLFFLIKI